MSILPEWADDARQMFWDGPPYLRYDNEGELVTKTVFEIANLVLVKRIADTDTDRIVAVISEGVRDLPDFVDLSMVCDWHTLAEQVVIEGIQLLLSSDKSLQAETSDDWTFGIGLDRSTSLWK